MNTGNEDFSDKVEFITPEQDCPFCHGTGEVNDWVDYGSTKVPMPSLCGCVEEQMEDPESAVEIVIPEEDQMWDVTYEVFQGEQSARLDHQYFFGTVEEAWEYANSYWKSYFGETTEPYDDYYMDESGEIGVKLYSVEPFHLTAMTRKGALPFKATWKVD